MNMQTRYFEKIGYKSRYSIGDRVRGKYNGIPFAGTVGNDRLVSELIGPEITIHLDLPIDRKTLIIVKHKDITECYNEDGEKVKLK